MDADPAIYKPANMLLLSNNINQAMVMPDLAKRTSF
jgi:hypothetical protein